MPSELWAATTVTVDDFMMAVDFSCFATRAFGKKRKLETTPPLSVTTREICFLAPLGILKGEGYSEGRRREQVTVSINGDFCSRFLMMARWSLSCTYSHENAGGDLQYKKLDEDRKGFHDNGEEDPVLNCRRDFDGL